MPAHDQPLDSNPADVGAAPRPRRFAPVATEPVARVSTPVPSGSFVPASVLDSLATMDREAADALEFGVIRCDDAGRITLYNRFQSRWAGVAVPAAEGKNFFTELAMCCNNRLVRGTFLRGVSEGRLDVEMTYTFNYRVRPTLVQMRLYRDPASGSNWVFILPL